MPLLTRMRKHEEDKSREERAQRRAASTSAATDGAASITAVRKRTSHLNAPANTTTHSSESSSCAASSSSATTVTLRSARVSPTAAVIISSEKPKRARDPSPSAKKKARRSTDTTTTTTSASCEVPRYNLRSTSARKNRVVATVTPRMAARELQFSSPSPASSSTTTKTKSTSELPTGVVDIYCRPTTRCCKCPVDTAQELVLHHLGAYGREFTEAMHESERVQVSHTFGPRALGPYHFQQYLKDAKDDDLEEDEVDYYGDEDDDQLKITNLRYRQRALALTETRTHFLDSEHNLLPRQPYVTSKMRSILVNWMVELGTEYAVSSQAFHLAVTLLDTMLALGPTNTEYFTSWYGTEEQENNRTWGICEQEDNQAWGITQREEFQALGWYVSLLSSICFVSFSLLYPCDLLVVSSYVSTTSVPAFGLLPKWKIGTHHSRKTWSIFPTIPFPPPNFEAWNNVSCVDSSFKYIASHPCTLSTSS
jgi:hypothetical protein